MYYTQNAIKFEKEDIYNTTIISTWLTQYRFMIIHRRARTQCWGDSKETLQGEKIYIEVVHLGIGFLAR